MTIREVERSLAFPAARKAPAQRKGVVRKEIDAVAKRSGVVDVFRFVGAAAIVWFHVHAPGATFALAALPMFVALTVYFSLRGSRTIPVENVAGERARRLLVPWLGWSIVYALGKVVDALAAGEPIASEFEPYMLLTGPQIHLWFLPFAFCAVICGKFLIDIRETTSSVFLPLVCFLAVSAVAPVALEFLRPGPPFAQWLSALPAVFLGIVLLYAKDNRLILFVASIISLVIPVLLIDAGIDLSALQNLIACILAIVCVAFYMPSNGLTVALSELSLGIYLLHPLVVSVLERISHIPSGTAEKALLVIAVSILGAAAIRRVPMVRRFV